MKINNHYSFELEFKGKNKKDIKKLFKNACLFNNNKYQIKIELEKDSEFIDFKLKTEKFDIRFLLKYEKELQLVVDNLIDDADLDYEVNNFIYIDRKLFTNHEHLLQFIYFYYNNINHICKIAERGDTEDSYSVFLPLKMDTENKKIYDAWFTNAVYYLKDDNKIHSLSNHFYINCNNADMIQIRNFKATYNASRIINRILFIKYLVEFTKQKNSYEKSFNDFLNFLSKKAKKSKIAKRTLQFLNYYV